MLNLCQLSSKILIRKVFHFPKKDLNLIYLSKQISTTSKISALNSIESVQKHNWNEAISKAEKIVGNPKSIFSIILSELGESSNPILEKAK